MSLVCAECNHKEDLIKKYLKLIKLQKIKCDKTTKSVVKNNTNVSETLHETSQQNSNSLPSNIGLNGIKSTLNPQKSKERSQKQYQGQLGLIIIGNKCKKALLKQSFDQIKTLTHRQQSVSNPQNCIMPNPKLNFEEMIKQTLSYGKKLQFAQNSIIQNTKELNTKIFCLQLKNNDYASKIAKLQKQIEQSQKRFMKQTQKKRESLETVAEQIRQKTELIVQLQHSIKRYEKTFGKSMEKIYTENMLNEDEQQMKKTILRLQNVNQKLNYDVKNAQSTVQELTKELTETKKQNQKLKEENKGLKERTFDLSQQLKRHEELQKVYQNLLQKLNKKIQSMRIKQRELCQTMKLSTKSHHHFCSQHLDKNDSEDIKLEKKWSLRQFEAQQKVQQIFSYLFNIKDQNYKINNDHLFDEDQHALLRSHKQIFLNSIKEEDSVIVPLKGQKLTKDANNLNETEQVFYLDSKQANQQNSFVCALEPKLSLANPMQAPSLDHMKLIELQIQKSKLIEKISELKNLHMHIRNVILNFLKALDISQLKSDSQSILEIIFEFFQYSEDQKIAIFREKKKKFWGLL